MKLSVVVLAIATVLPAIGVSFDVPSNLGIEQLLNKQLKLVQQDQASSVLSRHARASNKRGFEEVKSGIWNKRIGGGATVARDELISGNLERECIEETCDQHELFEVYDDENAPEILKYNQCNLFVNECEFIFDQKEY